MRWQNESILLGRLVAFLLIGALLIPEGRAQSRRSKGDLTTHDLLTEVNLRQLGYKPTTSGGGVQLPKFLDFVDINRLGVAWLTFDDPSVAQHTGRRTPRPSHLHVLVLDAETGQKQALQQWPLPSVPARFFGVRDGMFITLTGSAIRLFSPALEIIREQDLPSDPTCRNPGAICGGVTFSASRRVLLLSRYHPGPSYSDTLLDSKTLAPIASWSENIPILGVSEHWLMTSCGTPRQICMRGIDERWKPFQTSSIEKSKLDLTPTNAVLLSDQLVAFAIRNKMVVAKVDGTEIFTKELAENASFGVFVPSANGERFAVIEYRLRGLTSEPLDMYALPSADRVVVYSVIERRPLYAVKVKGNSPWLPWVIHVNQVAISPDGRLLAVVSDENLKIYRIPDQGSP